MTYSEEITFEFQNNPGIYERLAQAANKFGIDGKQIDDVRVKILFGNIVKISFKVSTHIRII